MKSKFLNKRWIIITLFVAMLGLISAWVMAIHSDAYFAANTYLNNSKNVESLFGKIKSTSLRGFRISPNHAYLKIHIEGSKNEGIAILSLKKDDQWRINAVALDD